MSHHSESDRHHRDVPAHDLRARGRGRRPSPRADRRAPGAVRSDRQPDCRAHGARRAGATWPATGTSSCPTRAGRHEAVAVMRKHRLAERLLVDVLGHGLGRLVHVEACRWEHVMSDAVERRILAHARPSRWCARTATRSPGWTTSACRSRPRTRAVPARERWAAPRARPPSGAVVQIERISEQIQPDEGLMRRLSSMSACCPGRIGCQMALAAQRRRGLHVDGRDRVLFRPTSPADHVFVHAEAPVRADPTDADLIGSAAGSVAL